MRLDKFDRQLRLMILLTQNCEYTLDQLCERLEISRRNLYYYIEGFKENGFIVEMIPLKEDGQTELKERIIHSIRNERCSNLFVTFLRLSNV